MTADNIFLGSRHVHAKCFHSVPTYAKQPSDIHSSFLPASNGKLSVSKKDDPSCQTVRFFFHPPSSGILFANSPIPLPSTGKGRRPSLKRHPFHPRPGNLHVFPEKQPMPRSIQSPDSNTGNELFSIIHLKQDNARLYSPPATSYQHHRIEIQKHIFPQYYQISFFLLSTFLYQGQVHHSS